MDQIPRDVCQPRVKICGITSVDDGVLAADAGADAIGLVFYQPSPRYVSIDSAAQIARSVGPFISTVGLFVNAEAELIQRVLDAVPLQVLQFHGDETAEFCEQFHRPYMKAIRMQATVDLNIAVKEYASAVGILLDTYQKGVPGGTGAVFDWDRVPAVEKRVAEAYPPIILAGGLTPTNVKAAIQQTSPYAVDVSGGVESSAGKKNTQQVTNFIANAKTV
ncbi:MAG: phosphoribosylanthranilate isomerase [Candidatus Endobugula sp.]